MFKSSGFGPRDVVAPATPTLRQRIAALSTTSALTPKLDEVRQAIVSSNPGNAIAALANGLQPLTALPQAMATVTAELGQIKGGIQALTHAMQHTQRAPSTLAFQTLARLAQVRDALCDLTPSPAGTANGRLKAERDARRTKDLKAKLGAVDPALADDVLNQFRDLQDDSQPGSDERRHRMAELMELEWRVVATVDDPVQPPASSLS
ncbi:hypothetical protein [Cupriavidus necator]